MTKDYEDRSAVYPLKPSTLETIDEALFKYINEELDIFCTTNQGFEKVPVIFGAAERAFQVKHDVTLREDGKTLKYPLISISKNSINQNPANKGRYGSYIPPYFLSSVKPSSLEIARVINQDKTKNFTNADSIRKSASKQDPIRQTFPGEDKVAVYNTLEVPMPAFVEVAYGVNLVTNYQQQLNEMLSPFMSNHSTPAVFSIFNEKNRYEAFIDPNYNVENLAAGLNTDERVFRASVNITVLGHIIGAGVNQETPNVVVHESAAKIRIQRERVVVGSEPHLNTRWKDKYRP